MYYSLCTETRGQLVLSYHASFGESNLSCPVWQHLTHTELLCSLTALIFLFGCLFACLLGFFGLVCFFFITRFLARSWTHKASKPQGSASLHLPSAGIMSVITYSFVSGFWELNSSPELCPFLFSHFLPVTSFLFHFSLTPFKRQTQRAPKAILFCVYPFIFSFSQK